MTAHRSRAVLFFVAIAAFLLDLGGFQIRGRAQGNRQVFIPTAADGYSISQTDGPEEKAPSGFEGRTDTSLLTALGNTPATRGKGVIARFKLSNKIRTCPDGDGAAEGEGEYSITIDSKDDNTNTADHFVMQARAKYKGKVNDDAYLEGPVKAEIDYTQSGGNAQHVTIPFVVGPGLSTPSFGPFSGGDPSRGRVSDAFDVGMGWPIGLESIIQKRNTSGETACVPKRRSILPVTRCSRRRVRK